VGLYQRRDRRIQVHYPAFGAGAELQDN